MIQKRKLNGKELAMAMKGVDMKKAEKKWFEYQLAYYKLMLDTGLEMNYNKNVRDFKAQEREFRQELDFANETIKSLISQIRDGVEMNDEKSDSKDNEKEVKLDE